MLRLQITGAPQAIAPAAAGQSEALAVAKRELAASQQEVALLREALASDSPESPSSQPVPLALTAGPTPVGVGLGGAVVRLSIRRPTGEYLKVEVGSQTLISELKATLVGLTDMPIRQQVRSSLLLRTRRRDWSADSRCVLVGVAAPVQGAGGSADGGWVRAAGEGRAAPQGEGHAEQGKQPAARGLAKTIVPS